MWRRGLELKQLKAIQMHRITRLRDCSKMRLCKAAQGAPPGEHIQPHTIPEGNTPPGGYGVRGDKLERTKAEMKYRLKSNMSSADRIFHNMMSSLLMLSDS